MNSHEIAVTANEFSFELIVDSLRDHVDERSETDLLDHFKINMYMHTASVLTFDKQEQSLDYSEFKLSFFLSPRRLSVMAFAILFQASLIDSSCFRGNF